MTDDPPTAAPAAPATTSVLIVDDHPAVREGLATRIARQADLVVCGEASDVVEALRLFEQLRPQVVVADVALKTGDGIDLVRRLRARDRAVRILVWSMYPESLYAERAFRAGANGYITKEHATAAIVEAVRAVRDNGIFVGGEPGDEMLRRLVYAPPTGRKPPGPAVTTLSDRELEVFRLIGQGLRTGEIAARLHISVHTLETHRQRIKAKLGLRSGPELGRAAVQWVLEHG